MKYLKYIKQFDFFSTEAKLTFKIKGETRIKTFIRGFISVLSVIISTSLTMYFFVRFITKNNKTLISSSQYSPNVNFTLSYKMPIMLRLSTQENQAYDNPESIYKIKMKYWYGGRTIDGEIQAQNHYDIDIEHCDINKHFGKFKYLFEGISDLETFYCPVERKPNETIYGLYGNIQPFSYYHFHIYRCNNSIECQNDTEITKILSNTYLDVRTVDNAIDSQNNTTVRQPSVRTDRHMISITVYKRIWYYLDWIEYTTDDGFFFEHNSVDYFHKVNSIRYDVDMRNITELMVPGTFLVVSILSTGQTLIYNRHFYKIQEFLANIGGLTKFISTMAFLLNYFVSKNTYYIKLLNGFVLEHYYEIQNCEMRSKIYNNKIAPINNINTKSNSKLTKEFAQLINKSKRNSGKKNNKKSII